MNKQLTTNFLIGFVAVVFFGSASIAIDCGDFEFAERFKNSRCKQSTDFEDYISWSKQESNEIKSGRT